MNFSSIVELSASTRRYWTSNFECLDKVSTSLNQKATQFAALGVPRTKYYPSPTLKCVILVTSPPVKRTRSSYKWKWWINIKRNSYNTVPHFLVPNCHAYIRVLRTFARTHAHTHPTTRIDFICIRTNRSHWETIYMCLRIYSTHSLNEDLRSRVGIGRIRVRINSDKNSILLRNSG